MDVGYYLGELLMQQGEVSVPGLGYFVQVRISGYYNDAERKFYPPYHQAQFDEQSIDDDALAEYIANKKNISVASARYFCEKYITNLKQQAAISEVQIGNLGWFYTELSKLTFKPADKIIDDTIFYGLEPISITKADVAEPEVEQPKVELNYPPALPQTTPPTGFSGAEPPSLADEEEMSVYESSQPDQEIGEDTAELSGSNTHYEDPGISNEFFEPVEEEEETRKSPLLLITVIVLFIVFIGLAIFALYRFKPETFEKIAFWQKQTIDTPAAKPKPIIPSKVDTIFADTVNIDTAAIDADTTATAAAVNKTEGSLAKPSTGDKPGATNAAKPIVSPPNTSAAISTVPKPAVAGSTQSRPSDAVGTHRFEVYVSPACKDMAEANRLITKLKNKGLDPRIVTDAPGTLLHISIGHFKTAQEAKAFAVKAQEAGKVQGDAYPFEIIP